MFDEVNVFVRKNELAGLLGISENEVNEIAISLDEYDQSILTSNILKKVFSDEIAQGELVVRPWTEITPSLNAMIKYMDYFSYVFLIIILIALAFGIVNTMLMVVMERIKELGMLKAIGMTNKRIFSMIMLETIFLSIVGGLLGLVISIGAIQYYGHYGLSLDAIKAGYNSLGFSSVIYPQASYDFYLGATILVIITAILASIYPARKALKLNPAEAIQQND
jgi:ABC-type antimicrobial peptide transport system permease subunit